MTLAMQQNNGPGLDPANLQVTNYQGQVVYIYAFDIAYEMKWKPVRELLGQQVAEFVVDTTRRNPKYMFMHRPQMVRLPPVERIGPHGPVRIERTIKILPVVGAISIAIKVPFQVSRIDHLVAYHDLRFSNGDLYSEVRQLAEQIRAELSAYCSRLVVRLEDEEAYTVFCLNSPLKTETGVTVRTEDWLHGHRRQVAALLTQETDVDLLSRQEAHESTCKFLSYYEDDLVVVDWDAALIIDNPSEFDETVHIMELANVQLTELEAYDRLLDSALERSYRDLSRRQMRPQSSLMRELREIRIDLARFSDELSNITKFIGDWHVARIYQAISTRFHLSDWHKTIDEKLKTLDDLYQMLSLERNNLWMLILEATIVLLFIIDLVMLFGK